MEESYKKKIKKVFKAYSYKINMTLKYDDLKGFVIYLKKKGFIIRISDKTLRFEIGKWFGISPYIIKNIIIALSEYGFIQQSTKFSEWEFVDARAEKDDIRVKQINKELEG